MKVRRRSADIISTLPESIIQLMLTLVPIRDAVRTSILSKRWRYCWVNIPKLVFDDSDTLLGSTNFIPLPLSIKYKVCCIVYQVFLLHQGPILEFKLSLGRQVSYSDIDLIILLLSKSNTVQDFTLKVGFLGYKLPSTFFSLQRLTHLHLCNCIFQPPLSFSGFSRLVNLYLYRVKIAPQILQLFISNCPLLKSFSLIGYDQEFLMGQEKYHFVEVLRCSVIEHLYMNCYPIMCYFSGGIPHVLPISIVHLKVLHLLDLCFCEQDELSSTLLLIQSSPNLEKLHILLDLVDGDVSEDSMPFPKLPVDVKWDHLQELEIENFNNLLPEHEFVKLILAKSSILKKVIIKHRLPETGESWAREYFRRLPNASPSVKLFFDRIDIRGPNNVRRRYSFLV